ncbi:MAG: DUF4386 domain-containing protein [Thermoplasmata archaeon]
MDAVKKLAVLVGALFIIATVASLIGSALSAPASASDYLTGVAGHANQVKVGALFQLLAAIAVVLIPAFLFPILRRHDEGIAIGYLGIRIVEAVVMVVGAVGTLLLVTLSQKYVNAGAPPDPSYQTAGAVLQGVSTWTFVLDPLVFGVGAALVYYLLARTRLVPLWLSLWGLVGAALVVGAAFSGLFGTFQFDLAVPIAVQEMALAGWLIFRGFNSSVEPPGTLQRTRTSTTE